MPIILMKHLELKFILLILCLLSSSTSFCQYYFYNDKYYDKDLLWEVGASFGSMHAYTDVGRRKFSPVIPANFDLKSAKTNTSIYIGFMYQSVVGARIEYTFGTVAAADSNGSYKFRNTNFRSDIKEVSIIGEFHPLMLKFHEYAPRLSPYIAAGIGVFTFNPQTYYKGSWVDLKPLSTEGQGFKEYPDRKPYALTSVCIPFGAGLKYEVSSHFVIRLEALARQALTDYLDDASDTSIDPSLYYEYFSKEKASLAGALTNRAKEIDANSPHKVILKGGKRTKDIYASFNLKVGLTLGRKRI